MALAIPLQCAVIIFCARVAGWAFRRMRQPMIIGEMFAGIALGPSIAGALFPEQHAALFTTASRPDLTLVGQAGVAIFMFIVGTRLKLDVFQLHSRPIAAIAAAAIVVPFALGTALAFPLHAQFAAP